jgi:hypothetical protein
MQCCSSRVNALSASTRFLLQISFCPRFISKANPYKVKKKTTYKIIRRKKIKKNTEDPPLICSGQTCMGLFGTRVFVGISRNNPLQTLNLHLSSIHVWC